MWIIIIVVVQLVLIGGLGVICWKQKKAMVAKADSTALEEAIGGLKQTMVEDVAKAVKTEVAGVTEEASRKLADETWRRLKQKLESEMKIVTQLVEGRMDKMEKKHQLSIDGLTKHVGRVSGFMAKIGGIMHRIPGLRKRSGQNIIAPPASEGQ